MTILKKYTRIAKMGDKWNAYLVVGVQSFCVVEQVSKTKAGWYAKMLAFAIENIIKEEKGALTLGGIPCIMYPRGAK